MKWYKNFVIIWSLIYLTVSFVGRFTSKDKEYFPFFRWSLYSKTPNFLKTPKIFVTKFGDKELNKPQNIISLVNMHHIAPVDMNLNVVNFYNNYNEQSGGLNTLLNTALIKSLPKGSQFELYVVKLNLTNNNIEISNTVKTKILTFKNNKFYDSKE